MRNENEKYVVTNVPDIPVSQQLQVTKDPEIRRARTVLLYMIHGLMVNISVFFT